MPPVQVLSELEKLAARIGVAVRYDAFDLKVIEGKGGLCVLRGRPVVVLDAGAPVLDKVAVLAEALSVFDLEALFVPPFVRARIGARARRNRPAVMAPVTIPGGPEIGPAMVAPPSVPSANRPPYPGLKRAAPRAAAGG